MGLSSNKAIKSISSGLKTGIEYLSKKSTGMGRAMDRRISGSEAIQRAIGEAGENGYNTFQKASAYFRNTSDGKLNYGKIAGTYMAGSAAVRIASGGGIYKDSDGNTDLIGVPFI